MKTACFCFTLSVFLLPQVTFSQTYFDTLGPSDSFNPSVGSVIGTSQIAGVTSQEIGTQFDITLPGRHVLDSVDAALAWIEAADYPNRPVKFDLWSADLQGLPDQLIESATIQELPAYNGTETEISSIQFSGTSELQFGESYVLTASLVGLDPLRENDHHLWMLSDVPHPIVSRTLSSTWSSGSNSFGGLAVRINAQAVPEPSSVGLLGLLAMGLLRRRRTPFV